MEALEAQEENDGDRVVLTDYERDKMLTVLMGAPGAGKTTWLKNNAKDEIILSTEPIRINRDLDREAFMNNLRLSGYKALKDGKSVIVDGTNVISYQRLLWLKMAKIHKVSARLITFEATLEQLIQSQSTRLNPVPYPVVMDHYNKFYSSLSRIDNEGWDEIVRIKR